MLVKTSYAILDLLKYLACIPQAQSANVTKLPDYITCILLSPGHSHLEFSLFFSSFRTPHKDSFLYSCKPSVRKKRCICNNSFYQKIHCNPLPLLYKSYGKVVAFTLLNLEATRCLCSSTAVIPPIFPVKPKVPSSS